MRVVGKGSVGPNPFIAEAVSPVQVAVVDDHVLVGRLVVGLMERAGYTAALVYDETLEATWAAVELREPDLVLLDFDLGPGNSSFELLQRAVAAGIVVAGFTGSEDLIEHARYIEAGGAVVVSKACGPADLVAVVELALAGEAMMSSAERHAALARLRRHRAAEAEALRVFAALTARESEALALISEGRGAAEIADRWDVSMPTIRSHIRAILTKLGVSSQLQAAAMARESGWYDRIAYPASSILTMPSNEEAGTIARQSGSKG